MLLSNPLACGFVLVIIFSAAACEDRGPLITVDGGRSPAGDAPGSGDLAAERSASVTACAEDPAAPTSTWSGPRRTMPWKWQPRSASQNVPDADGGASDARMEVEGGGAPACGRPSGFGVVECTGLVTVRRTATELTLLFPEGSTLRWDTTGVAAVVAPPAVADGEKPWIRFMNEVRQVCPFCGSYENRTLEIRTQEGGALLWVGREGHLLADVDETLVQDLFGVAARKQPGCHSSFEGGCWIASRQTFDHLLETTPPRLVRHAALERVVTRGGTFDLVWASASETTVPRPLCADGPAVARDIGFAASRIPSP